MPMVLPFLAFEGVAGYGLLGGTAVGAGVIAGTAINNARSQPAPMANQSQAAPAKTDAAQPAKAPADAKADDPNCKPEDKKDCCTCKSKRQKKKEEEEQRKADLEKKLDGSKGQEQVKNLGDMKGKSPDEIRGNLSDNGFTKVDGNNGGEVWTKPMDDGSTAAVRIDPAKAGGDPSFGDAVEHVHKEVVPTSQVTGGNYSPSSAATMNDAGRITFDPSQTHIPTR